MTTYVVATLRARIRAQPSNTARPLGMLSRGSMWQGTVVEGTFDDRPARWVKGRDGRYVYRELLREAD